MNSKNLSDILTFLRDAEQLKNTTRSGYTSKGREESVAEHTWRMCLMAFVFEKNFPEINFTRLIKMCIIHDLGEIIGGDIPAPDQSDTKEKTGNTVEEVTKICVNQRNLRAFFSPNFADIHRPGTFL